jgi:hypothetical protein
VSNEGSEWVQEIMDLYRKNKTGFDHLWNSKSSTQGKNLTKIMELFASEYDLALLAKEGKQNVVWPSNPAIIK